MAVKIAIDAPTVLMISDGPYVTSCSSWTFAAIASRSSRYPAVCV